MAWKGRRRRVLGVTLKEMLVTLGVLGVLAAIAVPAFHAYVMRMNRGDARRDLLALAAQLHRCFERGGNAGLEAAGSIRPCVMLPATNAEGTYTVSFAAGAPRPAGFVLVAEPQGAQARDTGCGALTLDERGQRGVTGRRPPAQCWAADD